MKKMVVSALARSLFVVVPVMYLLRGNAVMCSHSDSIFQGTADIYRTKCDRNIGHADFPFEYGTERKRKFNLPPLVSLRLELG